MPTDLDSIRNEIKPEIDRMNGCIRRSLTSPNDLLNQVVDYYLRSKGKQIRPVMVILSAKMCGGEVTEDVIASAAAIEMLHNSSLIHDDVIDDSRLRRNEPTINCLWDNRIAVLAGDYFVSTALQLAAGVGKLSIIETFSSLARDLSLGEMNQISAARTHMLSEEAYYDIIERKTASLFVACAEIGMLSVDADARSRELMRRFARLLGLCFQIKDDIFDYYESQEVGKPTGHDLREGKVTLPLLHVLTRHNAPQHDEMLALLDQETLTDEELARLTDYAKREGGIDYAYGEMERMRNEAAEIIGQFPESATRRAFIDLFDFVISRRN